MSKISILQVGRDNWSNTYELPDNVRFFYLRAGLSSDILQCLKQAKLRNFNAVLVDSQESLLMLMDLRKSLVPYTIFYDADLLIEDHRVGRFLKEICAIPADFSDKQDLLDTLSKALFAGQYGDKLFPYQIQVHPRFEGKVIYNGFESISLDGNYGDSFKPILNWSFNIRVAEDFPVELWLEFEKAQTCQCRLVLRIIPEGSVSEIVRTIVVSEEEMRKGAIVLDQGRTYILSATLEAKGNGALRVGNFHQRWTRFQFGKFVLGGGILHDSKRQEINYFFYPGDFKPPLSVYFSGFRPAEGFEGFGMMRAMETPFLLFSDPRLEGGAFYMGTEELENSIKDTIQHYLDYLGFDSDQFILSGMSMGTFPSMYYGADFEPHAIIMSKPLANVGTIGNRARLLAPEVFPTGIDVLHLQTGRLDNEGVEALNQKFWDKFEKADFSNTTFGVSYMKDEDMDPTAFEDITKVLYSSGARILSKGTSGRHNDDHSTATAWFLNFYRMILENDFGRKG